MLTGAPVLFLNLVKLLKAEGDFSIKIVIKDKRKLELVEEFRQTGEVLVWDEYETPSLLQRIKNRLFQGTNGSSKTIIRKNDRQIQQWINDSDFIICNTITNGDFLAVFNFTKAKVITYVHELEIACKAYTTAQHLNVVKKMSDIFTVPCRAVAAHLINNIEVPGNKIKFLNYYIPVNTAAGIEKRDYQKKFIVGIAGTIDWRKGADVFPLMVASFFKTNPGADILFVWKGADKTNIECTRAVYELTKLNLMDKVILEPPSKDVDSFYQSIDVLLLISKEDPYPLVVLEAASYKRPCICFESAGGAPEFVEDNAGKIIPFLDIDGLVKAVHTYYMDPELCHQHGENAYHKYQQLHNTKELIIAQFRSALAIPDVDKA